jgi:hypothetical protein
MCSLYSGTDGLDTEPGIVYSFEHKVLLLLLLLFVVVVVVVSIALVQI